MTPKLESLLWWIGLIVAGLYLFTLYQAAWSFSTDDAYITLRYSHHLFLGHGFKWNLDAEVVEGYSNFLYVLLGSLAQYFGWIPILFLKTVSVISLVISFYLLYRLARRWMPPVFSLLAPFTFGLYLGTIWWSVSGMETPFYVMLVLGIVLLFLETLDRKPNSLMAVMIGVLLTLASMTRPEAPVLWMCLNLAGWFVIRDQWARWKGFFILFNLSFLIPYGSYFLWRIWYFSRLLPNPVYCKAFDQEQPFALILEYAKLALPFSVAGLGFLDRRHFFFWLPSIIYLVILTGANPIIAYLTRHFLAAFSLLVVLGLAGLYQFLQRKISLQDPRLKWSATGFVLLFFVLGFTPHFPAKEISRVTHVYKQRTALRYRVADFLNANTTAHDWVAIPDCGLIPYLMHANVIDTLCLNSKEMTTPPISYSYERFADWLIHTKKPKWIVISYYSWRQEEDSLGMAISHHAELKQDFEKSYERVYSDTSKKPEIDYRYDVYAKLN